MLQLQLCHTSIRRGSSTEIWSQRILCSSRGRKGWVQCPVNLCAVKIRPKPQQRFIYRLSEWKQETSFFHICKSDLLFKWTGNSSFFPIPLLSVLVDSQDYRSWLCQAVRPQQPLRLFCGDSSVLGKWWRHNTFFSLHCRRFQRDLFSGFPGSRAYRETKVHSHCGLLELWNVGIWMHHRISSFLTFLAACSLVITIYLNQNFSQFCTIHIFCCLQFFLKNCYYTLDLDNVVFAEWVMISSLPRKIFFHHWIVALWQYKLIHSGLDELQDMQICRLLLLSPSCDESCWCIWVQLKKNYFRGL